VDAYLCIAGHEGIVLQGAASCFKPSSLAKAVWKKIAREIMDCLQAGMTLEQEKRGE